MSDLGTMLMSGQALRRSGGGGATVSKERGKGRLDAITNLGTLYELGQGIP